MLTSGLKAGDRVRVWRDYAADPHEATPFEGEVLEDQDQHSDDCFVVQWDDGHLSAVYPDDDRVEKVVR